MTKPKVLLLDNLSIVVQPDAANHPFINNQVKLLPEIIKRLIKHLDIQEREITFHFKRFKKLNGKSQLLGQYWFEWAICELSPRQQKETFIKSVCHEMVHAEQYMTGKLINVNGKRFWKGKLLDNFVKDVYDDKVITNPWEIEAYDRENDLQFKVMESLYWDGIIKY